VFGGAERDLRIEFPVPPRVLHDKNGPGAQLVDDCPVSIDEFGRDVRILSQESSQAEVEIPLTASGSGLIREDSLEVVGDLKADSRPFEVPGCTDGGADDFSPVVGIRRRLHPGEIGPPVYREHRPTPIKRGTGGWIADYHIEDDLPSGPGGTGSKPFRRQ
jgi:hypothetical protein